MDPKLLRKRKFNFKKMNDFYYLFLITAEKNIRASSRGGTTAENADPLEGIEYYDELYNDCIYTIPFELFLKNLKKEIAKVELLTNEHCEEILKEYEDVLKILPKGTKLQIEKIINGPFDLKHFRREKKISLMKVELFLKDYFNKLDKN